MKCHGAALSLSVWKSHTKMRWFILECTKYDYELWWNIRIYLDCLHSTETPHGKRTATTTVNNNNNNNNNNTTNHQPPTTNHQPPTTNHQPPTTNHQPPTTNHQPPTTNHQPPTTNHQPPTTNHQPPTTNHQPQQPQPQPHPQPPTATTKNIKHVPAGYTNQPCQFGHFTLPPKENLTNPRCPRSFLHSAKLSLTAWEPNWEKWCSRRRENTKECRPLERDLFSCNHSFLGGSSVSYGGSSVLKL